MSPFINKQSRIYQLFPFIIMGMILCYSWYCFVFEIYGYSMRHILALILFLANIIVYRIKFRIGILITGMLILFSMFNAITLFPSIFSFSLLINPGIRLSTPGIDLRVLLLLILFCICNSALLFYILFERKTDPSSKK